MSDILTVAYNMFSQGIDPELNLEDINEIVEICEKCTKMGVDERHPYAGKLVFTAFSGSHQDAINKGIAAMKTRKSEIWQVPYLPIDPADIGRVYEPVVRINSQSGKGGVAFVMSTYYGFKLPKGMHREFADVVQKMSERQGEVPPEQIMDAFRSVFTDHGKMERVEAVGNGPLDAVLRGLSLKYGFNVRILDYEEHALKSGSDSQAAAYIHLMDGESGRITYGVGVSSNITRASVRAIFSAINRLQLGDRRQGTSDSF